MTPAFSKSSNPLQLHGNFRVFVFQSGFSSRFIGAVAPLPVLSENYGGELLLCVLSFAHFAGVRRSLRAPGDPINNRKCARQRQVTPGNL